MSTQFKKRWAKTVAAAAVSAALWAVAPAAFAVGETTGGIAGTIETTGGATVGNASVTIKNTDTGLTRTVNTNESGSYSFPQLPIGNYVVTVTRDGVKVAEQKLVVNVAVNSVANFSVADAGGAEMIEVVGARPSAIDLFTSDSGLIVGEAEVDRLPVQRDLTAVTLLAPGVVAGDSAFGNLPSFGGATVGENVYYLNGLNLTNFHTGLGGGTVPFEFYKEWQVKTGGYSAQFGRSTGGVVNAVAKTGSNTFEWGANVYYTPEALREHRMDTLNREGETIIFTQDDERDSYYANIHASGALIQDKLFYYVLLNPEITEDSNITRTEDFDTDSNNLFWGMTLQYLINDYHTVDIMAFSDKQDDDVTRVAFRGDVSPFRLNREFKYTNKTGGESGIIKYTGELFDGFTMSAMYGRYYSDRTNESSTDHLPFVTDVRVFNAQGNPVGNNTAAPVTHGSAAQGGYTYADMERIATRLDFSWVIDDHTLKFGVDQEENTSNIEEGYSGSYWRRVQYSAATGTSRVRQRQRTLFGEYSTESDSFYLEDNWTINDRLTVNIGIRNDSFANKNGDDVAFIDINDQWAPRMGLAWDPTGDGTSKIYANWGRYYLPVANNTNERLAGNELFTEQLFLFNGYDAGDNPILGAALSGVTTFSNGEPKDVLTIVDQDIDPMFQDELIIGFQQDLGDNWSWGTRFVRRDLKMTLEDMAVDAALNEIVARGLNNTPADIQDCHGDGTVMLFACGFDYYLLGNPGEDVTMWVDWDRDGDLDQEGTLPANLLGYPDSERYYNAVEFTFDRKWDGKWSYSGSYTWSQSYGNNEGYVRSDNGQDDAGLTTLFDQPGLLDGAFGYLPNDRRHQIKMFGAYALNDNFTMSGNLRIQSGRPISCFGVHPTDEFAQAYAAESFYCNGQLYKRGSFGRTPWTTNLDVGMTYATELGGAQVAFKVDIFNLFDADGVTEVTEQGEISDVGDFNANFLAPAAYQAPRSVRFGIEAQF